MTTSARALAVLALALGSAGCATRYIPNTDVEDNDDNRRIIAFCERYRHAVEARNVPVILSMVSPSYFEDGGNADPSDDLDYAGLQAYLEKEFKETSAIRYEIRYRKVVPARAKHVYVELTYSASYKIPGLSGEEWHRALTDNRLELVDEGKDLKILAGM